MHGVNLDQIGRRDPAHYGEITFRQLEQAIDAFANELGLDARFVIETPLMWRDKAATWALARALGGPALVDLIVEETHSCYRGDRTKRHAWGYGCGACPACELRANGFDRYKAAG